MGNLLGNTLDALNSTFNIPEIVIGIILGLVTSIPELITFIESQRHYGKSNNDVQGVVEATSNLFASNMINLFIIESIGIVIFTLVSRTANSQFCSFKHIPYELRVIKINTTVVCYI